MTHFQTIILHIEEFFFKGKWFKNRKDTEENENEKLKTFIVTSFQIS